MPANSNRHSRLSVSGTAHNSYGPVSTSFYFDPEDDDKHLSLNAIDLKSPVAKAFAQLEGDDTFPTLTSDGLKVCLCDSIFCVLYSAFLLSPPCALVLIHIHSFPPTLLLWILQIPEIQILTGPLVLATDQPTRACHRQIRLCTDLFSAT
jgi:hypothetical protein